MQYDPPADSPHACQDVEPRHSCIGSNTALIGEAAVSCTMTFDGGKSGVRGLLCNTTTGACSEAR